MPTTSPSAWLARGILKLAEYLRPVHRFLLWLVRLLQSLQSHWFFRVLRRNIRSLRRIYRESIADAKDPEPTRVLEAPTPLPQQRLRRLTISSSANFSQEEPTDNAQLHSRLFNTLPPEIRLRIFELAVAGRILHVTRMPTRLCHVTCPQPWGGSPQLYSCWSTEGQESGFHHEVVCIDRFRDRDDLLDLAKTCRRMYYDTINLLYTRNLFDVSSPKIMTFLQQTVLPHRFNTIRSLQLSYRLQTTWWTDATSRDRRDWEEALLIVAGMEGLNFLRMQIGLTFSFPPISESIEDTIFAAAWKIELPRKWELITRWGETGATVDGAPFWITRDPEVLKITHACY